MQEIRDPYKSTREEVFLLLKGYKKEAIKLIKDRMEKDKLLAELDTKRALGY